MLEVTTPKLSLLPKQTGFPENANEHQIVPGTQDHCVRTNITAICKFQISQKFSACQKQTEASGEEKGRDLKTTP